MRFGQIFDNLILTYYSIEMYDILIIQDCNGSLMSIKIEEYERARTTEYSGDDEVIH